jgi:PiT family inorganic phosphate transporter
MVILLFVAVLFLTFANGANDNFKGVATLWGSGTLHYGTALILATIATFAGSVCSYLFAESLMRNFSGKGLIPDPILQSVDFMLAVALGGGASVLIATRFGFPVSTTHGLVGALVGAGVVAVGDQVNLARLGTVFLLPLLLGPLVAVLLGSILYPLLHRSRKAAGITERFCACVGRKSVAAAAAFNDSSRGYRSVPVIGAGLYTEEECRTPYQGQLLGVSFQFLLDNLHYSSAALVCFARGLNDTPKLVSLLLMTNLLGIPVYTGLLALAMAGGGLLQARRVAATMSRKISKLNHGQGFTANLVTGGLVIAASNFGLPVSTTHVSVGSIYGIGLANKTSNNKGILRIILSWVLTLPMAALLSAFFYFVLRLFLK